MEDSAFEAIYTGAYIFIFVAALTMTLYLFKNVNDLADRAYEYGNLLTDKSVAEDATASEDYQNIGYETSAIINAYYNYVLNDKYLTKNYTDDDIKINKDDIKFNIDFSNISSGKPSYTQIINLTKDNRYRLKYNGKNNTGEYNFSFVKI